MSIEWVNRAVDDLRAWGRAHGLDVDVDEVRLLCDYASDYLNVNELGDFTPVTFEELLLNIYPRKVIAPPESAPETVAAARTLVDFLLATEEIGGKMAVRMRVVLDRIEPEMPIALADTSKFGMAKSLFSAMGADSLEQGDVSVSAVAEPPDDPCECPGCSPLPPARLAPREALAESALRVPLVTDVRRLVQWMLAGGRRPTVKGRLRVRDAAEAAAQLAVADPGFLWRLAVHTGLVEVEGTAIFDGEDPDPLDVWAALVDYLVEKETGGAVTGSPSLDEELYGLCDMLYRLQAPVPIPLVSAYLEEIGLVDHGEVDVAEAVRGLAYCGIAEQSEETLELSALAVWGLREHYTDLGIEAPEAADLTAADAPDLIEGLLSGLPTEMAEADIQGWLRSRTPQEAATEMLGAASGAPSIVRGIAVTIVDRLGPEAEPAVRPYLDEAELRPHAVSWLSARGLVAPALSQDEVLWMSVDMLALAISTAEDDPEAFAENLASSGPPTHMIEEMWRVDHPEVVEVLELLGRSLNDQNVAKAARKAAFKARSRAIG
ncbi:hypothetical protein [Streptosporangium sp. NBC_01756]|uniref:hypothetical protein n=1 Tax=Streptosporangium sp. NBC_01756 TaxID=2975950 RepID=UPI002DDA0E8B|nr:hypothetical protein [Streptosporangium sp. NBC_01756]WSC85028.1 hypothetical protein OIE48_32380 [Streptosporangium sp. NBC_01756]